MNLTRVLFSATALLAALFSEQPTLAQQALTPRQEANLAAFAKLYGYVRYFHPSDEASSISWEQFANYGSLEVLQAGNTEELVNTLNRLFKPIAPAALAYSGREPALPSITPPAKKGYKPVAWQHEGVGISNEMNKNQIYSSRRINRPEAAVVSNDWSTVMQSINAEPYRNCEFRYSARLKVLSDYSGKAQLWFRVDNKKRNGFFDNMNDRPAVASQWATYTITGRINADADVLAFGIMALNPGKVLADDIKLEINKDGRWIAAPVANGDCEAYNANLTPEKWYIGKEAEGFSMQADTTDVSSGKAAMALIFAPKMLQKGIAAPLFDGFPQPGEYARVALGGGVKAAVPLALYGTDAHTYPMGDSISLQQLKTALAITYKKGQTADLPGIRFADVIIAWNIFKHFFPYWEDASATPDQLLRQALQSAATDKTPAQFLVTLQKMMAPLNDGHIWVFMANMPQNYSVGAAFARADGKVAVSRLIGPSLEGRLAPGDVVTAIDNIPVETFVAQEVALMSGSAQVKDKRAMDRLLSGAPDTEVKLDILHNGIPKTVTATRNVTPQAYAAATRRAYPMGWMKPGVYYIDLDREPMDSIRRHIHEIAGARALICDLRGYPNFNHGLIPHLMTTKESRDWMFVPRFNRPDQQDMTFKGLGWNLAPEQPHIGGKVFFLTDGRAISYAESYLGYVQDEKLGTIIGGPTAGTNGNINQVDLPGGYFFAFTGMLVKNHDGSKHHLKGIVPQVPVTPTLAGLAAGKDEVLDKALELAEK